MKQVSQRQGFICPAATRDGPVRALAKQLLLNDTSRRSKRLAHRWDAVPPSHNYVKMRLRTDWKVVNTLHVLFAVQGRSFL